MTLTERKKVVISFPEFIPIHGRGDTSLNNLKQIEEYLESLSSLGVRPAVNTSLMEVAHREKRVADLLGEVQRSLDIDCRLVLGKVRSGGPKRARAWVKMPELLPQRGTREFKNTQIIVYVRRPVLFQDRPHSLIRTLAHECSHIVLHSTWHTLRTEERAVDLCAMLLGYSEVFMRAHLVGASWMLIDLARSIGQWTGVNMVECGGYLEKDEVAHAHTVITKMRRRTR